MKRRELGIGIGLALASLVLLIGVLELTLRWVVLPALNPFAPHPVAGFQLKADFDGVYPRTPVRTDARRHRIPMDGPGDRTGEILFIGDSVTFGYGIEAQHTFVERLGERIGRPRDVTNAAVPAYNLFQTLVILEREMEWARPELVVYGAVYNDLLAARADLEDAYLGINPHAGPGGGLSSYSLLYALIKRRSRRLAARWEAPENGGRPRDTDASESEEGLLGEVEPEVVREYRRQWRELEAVQRRTGVPFYVLILPYRTQIEAAVPPRDWQEFVTGLCGDGPLICLDPLDALRRHADEALYNGRARSHFNPRGHQLLADWLADRLPLQ